MTTKRKILTAVLAILSILALIFVSRTHGQESQVKSLSGSYNCGPRDSALSAYYSQACKIYDPETGKHYIVVNSYYGVSIVAAD